MPDFLLELFSEEIPARMQAKAAEDLRKLVTDRLVAAGLTYEGAKAFATPRRLTLSVHGLPAKQPDLKEEKRGPRVGAPPAALAGFLKSAGLLSRGDPEPSKRQNIRSRSGVPYQPLRDRRGSESAELSRERQRAVRRSAPDPPPAPPAAPLPWPADSPRPTSGARR